jgi:hypothetical protein
MVPILGYGKAKFSLNGKIILVHDALHCPPYQHPYTLFANNVGCPAVASFLPMILVRSSVFLILLLKSMTLRNASLILNPSVKHLLHPSTMLNQGTQASMLLHQLPM